MGVAHIGGVGGQLLRQLAVSQRIAVLVQPPRAQVDLVNIHWLLVHIAARGEVFAVAPFISTERIDL